MKTLTIDFPDNVRFPERMVQQFDYHNNNPYCCQSDIDFVFHKDNCIVVVESKMRGTEIRGGQKRMLEVLCNDSNKCAVVVHHQSSVQPVVKMVDGWSQTVSEFWYDGKWQTVEGEMNLRDFLNYFFRAVWDYEEDVIT